MITRRQTTNYLQRCDQCNRVGHSMYYFDVAGKTYRTCSNADAEILKSKLEPKVVEII